MRVWLALACCLSALSASAQDMGASQGVGILSELRLGLDAHDPWSPEKGSVDIKAEVLFQKPVLSSDPFWQALTPRPHLGASFNLGGKTDFAYAGLTWTFDLTDRLFAEATFGGAVHDGKTGRDLTVGRNALGCPVLFRESAGLGFKLSEQWVIMGVIEHLSNAGLCDQNRGLTQVGARLGYRF